MGFIRQQFREERHQQAWLKQNCICRWSTRHDKCRYTSIRYYNLGSWLDRILPIVTDHHRLSPIITDCHRLSPIITDCHRLSPIITVYHKSLPIIRNMITRDIFILVKPFHCQEALLSLNIMESCQPSSIVTDHHQFSPIIANHCWL